MNKAFVREPDESDHLRCPRCQSLADEVGPDTLAAFLPAELIGKLASGVGYCSKPECPVAYFDSLGQFFTRDQLTRPAYPKHPHAPLGGCLGISANLILADAAAKNPARVRSMLAQAQSNPLRCRTSCASGKPCTAEAQRLYLQQGRK